jgi:quinol monooxygenase YgiN
MAILNILGVVLGGDEYKEEFLEMVAESLRLCGDDPTCTYIDAWQHPVRTNDYVITSIWKSEEDLLNWYNKPFHIELRKRGREGLLKGYFNHQGELDESKSHKWNFAG